MGILRGLTITGWETPLSDCVTMGLRRWALAFQVRGAV